MVKKKRAILERQRTLSQASTRDGLQQARRLSEILTVLNSDQPLDQILDYIVRQAGDLLQADGVAIYRLVEAEGLLTVEAARGLDPEYVTYADVPLGQLATGRAALEQQPVVIENVNAFIASGAQSIDPVRHALLQRLSTRHQALLSVPLMIKNQPYGVLTLYYYQPRTFSSDNIRLAASFCDQVALAIENARLHKEAQQAAVMAERNRLARDLHDSVTQTLFSANLIAEVLPAVWERDQAQGLGALEELHQLTRGALAEMRALLIELRPNVLRDAHLEDVLTQLGRAVTSRTRLPIRFSAENVDQLPADVRVVFYRVAQEALNNITKHSGASQVEMTLHSLPPPQPGAELYISDDGCGFDPAANADDHLGLGIMRERAASVGARLAIESQPGCGTRVRLAWVDPSFEDKQ